VPDIVRCASAALPPRGIGAFVEIYGFWQYVLQANLAPGQRDLVVEAFGTNQRAAARLVARHRLDEDGTCGEGWALPIFHWRGCRLGRRATRLANPQRPRPSGARRPDAWGGRPSITIRIFVPQAPSASRFAAFDTLFPKAKSSNGWWGSVWAAGRRVYDRALETRARRQHSAARLQPNRGGRDGGWRASAAKDGPREAGGEGSAFCRYAGFRKPARSANGMLCDHLAPAPFSLRAGRQVARFMRAARRAH